VGALGRAAAQVWQMQRNETNRKEIEGMMAIVAKGDALDKAQVQKIFDSERQPASSRWRLRPAASRRGRAPFA
jgi:hypothetical protein